jgi:hypothetical protein
VVEVGARVLLASVVPAAVVGAIAWIAVGPSLDTPANLAALAVLGAAGAFGYFAMAFLVGLREPSEILARSIGSVRSWARR